MILAPGPKSSDGGKGRLYTLAQSASVEELAQVHRFVAHEDVASVKIVKQVPVRLEVTLHDGRTLKLQEAWTGELMTKQSRDNLVAGLQSRLPQAGARTESTWSK